MAAQRTTPELRRRLAAVRAEYAQEVAARADRRRRSLEDRIRQFEQEEKVWIGRRRWYAKWVMSLAPCDLLAFEDSRELCLMRGSIHSLQAQYGRGRVSVSICGYWAGQVLARQIRRWARLKRVTALSQFELQQMLYSDFWKAKVDRLESRYGRGKYGARDLAVEDIIKRDGDGWKEVDVILNGEVKRLRKDDIENFRELSTSRSRLLGRPLSMTAQ